LLLMEAARYRGYAQSAWEREPWHLKSSVLAQMLAMNIREGFTAEQARKSAKNKDKGPKTDWAAYRQGGKKG
jgi:hypothetical protein